MTWNEAWGTLNSSGKLEERPQQRTLAEAVFAVTQDGGCLIGEAGTGTGKSFAYLLPLIYQAKEGKRSVVSTETLALQDQLIDKDLPFLKEKFGGFEFRSLKGRSNYLCAQRAGSGHPLLDKIKNKMSSLGEGERRDVERVLGRLLDDDDWSEISGESDWCAMNKCTKDRGCYSSRARELALKAHIVVCNHAVLRTHAEMKEDFTDGLLGEFKHLVVDEAHTLEKVLVDGWGFEMSPWDRHKNMKSIWDGLDAAFMTSEVPHVEQAEKLMMSGLNSAVKLFSLLAEKNVGRPLDDKEWKRQSFAWSEQYLSGNVDHSIVMALEDYELQGPGRFKAASDLFADVAKRIKDHLESMEKGTRKVRKGMNAAKRMSKIMGIMAESLTTRDGIVMDYGVPYAVIGDGWKAWKGGLDVRVRCVPLDVSVRARETIWDGLKSVTLVSATLSDAARGDFTYTLKSLGLWDRADRIHITVDSPFDYAKQQLLYLTPENGTQVDVPGAQYSIEELEKLLLASDGRSLVLFTARTELEHAADELRYRNFPHRILSQELGTSKQLLVDEFKRDTHSVLLATKSFFTGVDFPGETCSVVVLCKYPLPQYNTLCRAQIAWWRGRGFPNWYEREGTLVARQAVGRLIRNERDRGVIALIDQRQGMHEKIVEACQGSYVTKNTEDVRNWLNDAATNV